MRLKSGGTKSGRLHAVATKIFNVAPNICGTPLWNFLHFSLLAPTIFTWLLDF